MKVAFTSAVDNAAVFSVYRSLLREARALPVDYLRVFHHVKAGDAIRSLLETKPHLERVTKNRFRRVYRDLKTLRSANAGDQTAFRRVLAEAYARKGRLRWEILQPLLSDPAQPAPQPIIPGVPRSRPPVFSPELSALLSSGLSHSSRPLRAHYIETPKDLPERSNPNSREAHLLGPFSKRREVNIRWRFFTGEIKKLLLPLEAQVLDIPTENGGVRSSSEAQDLVVAGVRPIGFQGAGIRGQLDAIANSSSHRPPTRRERGVMGSAKAPGSDLVRPETGKPSRFLRRRYGELAKEVPILTWSGVRGKRRYCDKYDVVSSSGIPAPLTMRRLPDANGEHLAWIGAVAVEAS